VDSFAAPISAIEKEVSEIEDQIYTTRVDDIQAFLSHHDGVRRSIVSLMNLLSGKADVLNRFKKHHKEYSSSHADRFVDNDIHLYMDDVEDHVVTILSNLRQFESLLARSQESYFAQLSVDNAIGRSKVTGFLKKALVLTSIMTFYLVICSLFSMNVGATTPLFQRDNLTAFAIILASWVLIGIILILVARRYRAF
jgi:Mg2+ and Co2+ transporter CorA